MVKLLLLGVLLFCSLATAQTAPVAEEILKPYRLALMEKARHVWRYPKKALERKIEGKAIVRLTIGEKGGIRELKVDPSSGHSVLDAAAFDMVWEAHQAVPLPEALRGKRFTVSVPVIFAIKQE